MRSSTAATNISGEGMIPGPTEVVLADPGLLLPQLPQPAQALDQREVRFQRHARILMRRVEEGEEAAIRRGHGDAGRGIRQRFAISLARRLKSFCASLTNNACAPIAPSAEVR